MNILSSAFSLNMLPRDFQVGNLLIQRAALWEVTDLLCREGLHVNVIGHPTTNDVIRALLLQDRTDIGEGKRITVSLSHKDTLIVAQYEGPRLEEGATTLPTGAKISWFFVMLQ